VYIYLIVEYVSMSLPGMSLCHSNIVIYICHIVMTISHLCHVIVSYWVLCGDLV